MSSVTGILFSEPQPYAPCSALQERLVEARREEVIPDTILFLEHAPVITLGVRGIDEHILQSPAELQARGIGIERSPRGGDVTFHGPGQIVVYPILHLDEMGLDVHGYVTGLEEMAIGAARVFGVEAFRRKGLTGVWTAQGKLAAIGVRFKHRVAYHGLSFNVNVDLAGFATIVPCGLAGEPVTSLHSLLGKGCPSMADARAALIAQFEQVFNCRIDRYPAGGPLPAPYVKIMRRPSAVQVAEPDAGGV